jgi:hypothetical protein
MMMMMMTMTTTTIMMMMMLKCLRVKKLAFLKTIECLAHLECGVLATFFLQTSCIFMRNTGSL